MIIELSKDKSLKNLLLKASIDNETMLLVKADASITDIKDSLINNLSSDNIVTYRKYISKAEDEEEVEEDSRTDEETRDDVKDELDESLSTTAAGGGGTGVSQTQDLDISDKENDAYFEETESRRKQIEHKKMYKEVKNISRLVSSTEVLSQNIVVKKSKATLTGYKFLNFAAWVGKKKNEKDSNTLINLLTVLKEDPNFLNIRYKTLLTSDGKLEVIETKRGTKTQPINVKGLVETLLGLSGNMVIVEGTEDKMSFYDVLVNLHINEIEKNPTVKQNRSLWAKNLRRAKEIASSSDKSNEDLLKDSKATIENIQKEHANLKDKQAKNEEQIKILESLLEGGTDGIIARKINRLTDKVKSLMTDESHYEDEIIPPEELRSKAEGEVERDGKEYNEEEKEKKILEVLGTLADERRIKRTKTKPKLGREGDLSELRELINEISEGRVDVIEETTEEIQKDLENEQKKLLNAKESIERMNQFEGELTQFLDIYDKFPKSPEVTSGATGIYATGRPKADKDGKVDTDKVAEYDAEDEKRKDEVAAKERWDSEISKLNDLGSTLESIHRTLKRASKILKKLDDFEAAEFKEWVSGQAGSRPAILEVDNEWLQLISDNGDVLDTYDNRDIVQMEKLSHQLVKKYEKIDKLKGALKNYMGN